MRKSDLGMTKASRVETHRVPLAEQEDAAGSQHARALFEKTCEVRAALHRERCVDNLEELVRADAKRNVSVGSGGDKWTKEIGL